MGDEKLLYFQDKNTAVEKKSWYIFTKTIPSTFCTNTPCTNSTLHIQSMFYVKMVVVWTSFTRSFTTPFPAILMMNFNFRNVVTGAHYHFVSRWTSSSAYIAASLVMMVFVSKLDSFSVYVQWLKYKQSLMKILKITLILGKIWGANTSSFWKETKLWVFRDCLVLEYCTSIHLPPFGVPEKYILVYKFPNRKF